MIVLAVDDEFLMLPALVKALEASPDVEQVAAFSCSTNALEWVQENPVDAVFLDLEMRGLDSRSESAHPLPCYFKRIPQVCEQLGRRYCGQLWRES